MLATGKPGQSWPRTRISSLWFFCLLNNLKKKKKKQRTDTEELHIVYIPPQTIKKWNYFPLCHITVVGFAKIRIDPFAVCFPKVIHTLCLVIVNSSINVFNELISFFRLWSVLLPSRLSPGSTQLHPLISFVLPFPCFVHCSQFYWVCGNRECIC